MEGAFSKSERLPETPTSTLGNKVYEYLQLTLPPLLNLKKLNSNAIYQNPNSGFRMSFNHTDGARLTHAEWQTVQDVAKQYFTELKNTFIIDSLLYESLDVNFIDNSDENKQTIIIKPRLQ